MLSGVEAGSVRPAERGADGVLRAVPAPRRTPEQERGRMQAIAQRDGFVYGYMTGRQVEAGAVSGNTLAEARRLAKERFPIFALRCREQRDPVDPDFLWRFRDEVFEVARSLTCISTVYADRSLTWYSAAVYADDIGVTPERVRFLAKLMQEPDEFYITDE